jgi:AcrR family transcriptional regulator
MTRTVKNPDVRRKEILAIAGELFQAQGYQDTTVDAIIRKVGIAKGTFYYYFQSKEEVLAALVHELVSHMVEKSRTIADDPTMNALEKTRIMLRAQSQAVYDAGPAVMENLHRPENRELHERSNVETILTFGPIMADVVEQGNREGIFHVEQPLETVQFLLAGSEFLFAHGLFNWKPEELIARTQAMQSIIERSLGAEPGSFGFLIEGAFEQ